MAVSLLRFNNKCNLLRWIKGAVLLLTLFFSASLSCRSDEFQCRSGHCINIAYRCDNDDDCQDASDESPELCMNATCPEGYFHCELGGQCIPLSWVCDGASDCNQGTDEHATNCLRDRECQADEFRCNNTNVCISATWVCDHDPDCPDGSDEHNCQPTSCSALDQFSCTNGRCVEKSWVCDGDDDCLDMSDEENCHPAFGQSCASFEFTCTIIHECIHSAWKCDGDFDCQDQSDENQTMCGIRTCAATEFQCYKLGSCISKSLMCNGQTDCDDGSDEFDPECTTHESTACDSATQFDCNGNGSYCISRTKLCNKVNDCRNGNDEGSICTPLYVDNSCTDDRSGCLRRCVPIGSSCVCPRGFQFATDNQTCTDIDECLTPGSCSQDCINTVGSYRCKCVAGYILEAATQKCRATGHEPLLLFSNRYDLRMMSIYSGHFKDVVDSLHSAIALDYDYRAHELYWSDVAAEKIFRITVNESGSTSGNKEAIVTEDIKTSDGLAVDWVHRNLYWTDTAKNTIEVMSLGRPMWRTVVVSEGLDEPRAIVVDPRPQHRYMYWSDWGTSPKIERAVLDGSERSPLITANIAWPNGLTLDLVTDQLFWADAKRHTISAAKLDGSDVRIVFHSAHFVSHPFSIAVFEDTLYWSDWTKQGIMSASKFHASENGDAGVQYSVFNLHSPMDVHIFHELQQPSAASVCAQAGCNQLCLPNRQTIFKCICTGNYTLASDGKTCLGPDDHVSVSTEASDTWSTHTTVVSPVMSQSHVGITVTILLIIFAAVVIVALVLYRRYQRSLRKVLDFDNPVYRHTTTRQILTLEPKSLSSMMEPLTSNEVL